MAMCPLDLKWAFGWPRVEMEEDIHKTTQNTIVIDEMSIFAKQLVGVGVRLA